MKTKVLSAVATAVLTISLAFSQPGSLDSDFDADGIVLTSLGTYNALANAVAVQKDSKIVVAGFAVNSMADDDFALLRYNPDGSPDVSFNTTGKVQTALGPSNDFATCIAIQQDGKILVGGYLYNSGYYDAGIVRYNTDGSVDGSFGSAGVDTFSFTPYDDYINAIDIQPDGKIFVSGTTNNGTDSDMALARLNTDGSLDSTFGTDGKVITNPSGSNDYAPSMALQSDGKIILGGSGIFDTKYDFCMVRYNTNGSIDSSFDFDGKVITSMGIGLCQGTSLLLLPDGKIVFAGKANDGNRQLIAVAKYNSDGTLDHSFHQTGKFTTYIPGIQEYIWISVIREPDSKLIISGTAIDALNNGDIFLMRLDSAGTVDSTFGNMGVVSTDIKNNSDDRATAAAMQPDGRILVAGSTVTNDVMYNRIFVCRYLTGVDVTGLDHLVAPYLHLTVYPNPVSDEFRIRYTLPHDEDISLRLFNLQGRQVQTLLPGQHKPAGNTEDMFRLDPSVPAGVYLLELFTGEGILHSKIIKQ